ncbi:MAG: hypothetical protein R3E79_31390 [Caldilineaceae bacterium]
MAQADSVGGPIWQADRPSKSYGTAHVQWMILPTVYSAQPSHAPPLPPLKPALPTLPGRQETRTTDGKLALISALSSVTGEQGILPTALVTEQPAPLTATVALPQSPTAPFTLPREAVVEEQPAPQITAVEPLPTLETVLPPQPATPTSNAPMIKATATPTLSASHTPVFSIFEPTMPPTTVVEGQTSTGSEEPTATATISIQPWHTPTSETAATPSSEENAAITTATEAVAGPSPTTPTP